MGDKIDDKIPNLKNRKRTRLRDFDYSQSGYYFVTICSKDKTEHFGRIEDGTIILNQYGRIVEEQWLWLGDQYVYVQLDEFVVMPNHFHGILIIDPDVGNGRDRSLPKIKPLPELIGAFKTISSKKIHEAGLAEFKWQKSFYDHIIRNDKSLYRIRKYIINNPLKWEYDQENLNEISKREKISFWKEFLK